MPRSVNLETATHVAGPVAKVDKRFVQRCCICGFKLADNGDEALHKFWSEGEMVRVKCDNLCAIGKDFASVKYVPLDLCIDLVE